MLRLETFHVVPSDSYWERTMTGHGLIHAAYLTRDEAMVTARKLLMMRIEDLRAMAGREIDRHRAAEYLRAHWERDPSKQAVAIERTLLEHEFTVDEGNQGRQTVEAKVKVTERHAVAAIGMTTEIADGVVTQTHTVGTLGEWSDPRVYWEFVGSVDIVLRPFFIGGSSPNLSKWVEGARPRSRRLL